jgi:selenocysteine lyase/cysteine desulfurase
MAAERGMVVKTLPFDRDTYEFDLDELASLITPRTRFASLNYASNILGTINPVRQMVAMLKAAGAITYVDAVQYAPHGPIDVQAIGSDFLVASAYKFYGPHQGILHGRREVLDRLHAYKLRVVPDVPPNKFETGTQSLEGQAGVLGALEYLQWLGVGMGAEHLAHLTHLPPRTAEIHAAMIAMADYEHSLSGRLIEGLQSIEGVHVHGITDPEAFGRRVPTVSFSRPGTEPAAVATFLDEHGVYVWNGHSYALPVIEWLGLADAGGVVRIGPTHYNTLAEVDTVVELVREFVETH